MFFQRKHLLSDSCGDSSEPPLALTGCEPESCVRQAGFIPDIHIIHTLCIMSLIPSHTKDHNEYYDFRLPVI